MALLKLQENGEWWVSVRGIIVSCESHKEASFFQKYEDELTDIFIDDYCFNRTRDESINENGFILDEHRQA